MKTDYLDYLLSAAVISGLLAATFALTTHVTPLSRGFFAEYHVIVDFMVALLSYGLLSALALRLMLKIRPIRRGEYSFDSGVFTYWKLLTVVHRLGHSALLPFTPVFVRPVVETLFGARIGANVALGGAIDDPYLVSIGEGAVLGFGSLVSGNVINNGKLIVGEVKIGKSAIVGVNSVILAGTEVGDNAVLLNGSYVVPGIKIPSGETWRGNPARKWQ